MTREEMQFCYDSYVSEMQDEWGDDVPVISFEDFWAEDGDGWDWGVL
jgi:hypothetical protein